MRDEVEMRLRDAREEEGVLCVMRRQPDGDSRTKSHQNRGGDSAGGAPRGPLREPSLRITPGCQSNGENGGALHDGEGVTRRAVVDRITVPNARVAGSRRGDQ